MTTMAIPAAGRSSEDGLAAFLMLRPRLFRIACRILGNASEADDVVQDVWVRWQMTDRAIVRDAAAFLATATTRLAINVLQSARSRRESHFGPALPELPDTDADQSRCAERAEALDAAWDILADSLSPRERAAFVLREAFEYAYRDIARVLGLREANARQIVRRARRRVASASGVRARLTATASSSPVTPLARFSARASRPLSPARQGNPPSSCASIGRGGP